MKKAQAKAASDEEARVRLREELATLEGRTLRLRLELIRDNPALRRRYRFAPGELEEMCRQAGAKG